MFKNFPKKIREMLSSDVFVGAKILSFGYIVTGFLLGICFGFEKGFTYGIKMGFGVGMGGAIIMLAIASLVWLWDKPAENDC